MYDIYKLASITYFRYFQFHSTYFNTCAAKGFFSATTA